MTVGLVSGAAYALFSDTVTISGLSISTGNADIELNYTGNNDNVSDYQSDDNIVIPVPVAGLYPGSGDNAKFYLRNISKSPISLRPKIRLTNAETDWNSLKDLIQIKITDRGTDGTGTYSWGWQNLSWWNAESRTITNTSGIAVEASSSSSVNAHEYKIEVEVLSSATSAISEKTLSNIVWQIDAEQVTP